ncbi:MAG: hypothetical protein E7649_00370 [Ruminococcaceae bacterium]|nr:hypothetical protein [Oscillospiraceae bacterium]
MKIDQNDKLLRKKLYVIISLCFAIAYALCCFVLSPLGLSLDANVVFAKTVLPAIVRYLGIGIELVSISVFYGVMIYGMYRFGPWKFRGCVGIFAVATVCKYLANTVMSWATYDAAIPRDWPWDLATVAFYTALEMLQLWIIIAIVRRKIEKSNDKDLLPFSKVYDKGNALMRCAKACGVVTVIAKLFGRIANDAWAMILSGPPQKVVTVISMLINYLSVAVLGVICYAVTVAVIGLVSEK